MDFLIYGRASIRARHADDSPELDERHWSYLDRFANRLTARGPVLGRDRQSWRGSIHVLDLPDADAVGEFIRNEPYHQAGAYADYRVWYFANLIGRTMWQFDQPPAGPLFFVLVPPMGQAPLATTGCPWSRPGGDPPFVVLGLLDDTKPSRRGRGIAAAVPASDAGAADAVVDNAFPALRGRDRETLDWTFGGRVSTDRLRFTVDGR